jgi:hypothetical protein
MTFCLHKNRVLATTFHVLPLFPWELGQATIAKTTFMSNTIPHQIDLPTAVDLTSRFQNNRPGNMPVCETFDRASVLAVLNQPSAAKFRLYLGQKPNGDICNVLVAADENDRDILPTDGGAGLTTEDEGLILEDSVRCPELCPPESPLNP